MASVRMHKSMDAAFNYDQHGQPKHQDVQMRWKQRVKYVQTIRTIDAATEQDVALSKTLARTDIQGLAHAIKVYLDPGKLGFYDKILAPFQRKHPE
jgi:hypothetical protein